MVNKSRPKSTTAIQKKKKNKDNTIFCKIIQQKVNLNLYTNVIQKHDLYQL